MSLHCSGRAIIKKKMYEVNFHLISPKADSLYNSLLIGEPIAKIEKLRNTFLEGLNNFLYFDFFSCPPLCCCIAYRGFNINTVSTYIAKRVGKGGDMLHVVGDTWHMTHVT